MRIAGTTLKAFLCCVCCVLYGYDERQSGTIFLKKMKKNAGSISFRFDKSYREDLRDPRMEVEDKLKSSKIVQNEIEQYPI
ncbi:hypothetical protein MmiHf6_09480 [Methanimicrococcus hongohii]|uniref:Uncharacterized protein n=1 Tax=Methanimicrococcus hongohii TaxID=3028295 RepID=A0AA96UZR7_9EURY|nr:hypothetical protein MmiHf6_09480 [Methanimicrococcus sp. Hf6]